MFWAHGNKDDIIAFSCQASGVAALTAAGIPVTAKEYDFGHDSSEAEFSDMLQVYSSLTT
jgi:predicted esterase